MKITFLGAGKMATAIACGVLRKEILPKTDILASDINDGARRLFGECTGIACQDDNSAVVNAADIVILAVKPQDARKVLESMSDLLGTKLLVSIAAGLSIDKLSQWSNSDRIVRVMPNTPAMVGMGTAVYSCGRTVTVADREFVDRLLGAVGIVREMEETMLDVVTGLSGSGPAYVFEFIQAMVDGAVSFGMDPEVALSLVVQTVGGAAEMLRLSLGSPDDLRDAVTSPGGTTAAGIDVLNNANFRHIMASVIKKATERSVELGRN